MADKPASAVVLAIDPGRAKCGIAVVSSNGCIFHRAVVARADLGIAASELLKRFQPEAVLLGNGTHAKAVWAELVSSDYTGRLELVDERHTSEVARARYLAEHPPRGLGRLVPLGLRTPDAPYDDYVGILLAERWWKRHEP